jgi:hypothetical protein
MKITYIHFFTAIAIICTGLIGACGVSFPNVSQIPLQELIGELERKDIDAHQVLALLARAAEKDKKKAILNKFSVSDLLDLNIYKKEDCTKEKFQHRVDICEDLKDNKALREYCEFTLDGFVTFLINTMEEDYSKLLWKINPLHQNKISKFRKSVLETVDLNKEIKPALNDMDTSGRNELVESCMEKEHSRFSWKINQLLKCKISKFRKPVLKRVETVDLNQAIELVLKNMDMPGRNKLIESCAVLLKELSQYDKLNRPTDEIIFRFRKKWLMSERFCSIAIEKAREIMTEENAIGEDRSA